MIAFIQEYWSVIIVVIAVLYMGINFVYTFASQPTESQKAKVLEWLLFYVAQAEKELGGGTGQLKLRYVYDAFLTKFPQIALVISFETFSSWVDIALEKFEDMIKQNQNVKQYVGKE